MAAEDINKKHTVRKLFWILLGVIIIGFSLYSYRQFGCYFIDRQPFFSPIYHSGEVPVRDDAYGDGDFGAKRSGKRLHLGVDILAAVGTPVYAAKCGLVINAETNRGLGQYVEILHHDGLVTIYGHLSRIDVYQGQRVCQGDKIGEAGKTGNARNRLILPHLHFEVRKFGVPQDPMFYLSRRK